jgi:tetratricopeptide (TPR) repeat protein
VNLLSLLPKSEDLSKLAGVERDLHRRRRLGSISFGVAVAGFLWNVVSLAATQKDYFSNLAEALKALTRGGLLQGDNLFYLAGLALLVGGSGSYALLRWTRILIRESQAPFQYTFWVDEFKPIEGTPGNRMTVSDLDRMKLLSPDIAEKLKGSLERLLLLSSDAAKATPDSAPHWSSHIRISGSYTVREEQGETWHVQVMPRVCIGPPGSPEFPAPNVRCALTWAGTESAALTAATYERVVEEVYGRIAGEIYRQIKQDVERKIQALPTLYLRAVALFHEAEDFARSKTADGYDLAVELYRKAKDHFQSSNILWLSRACTRLPLLWRFEKKFSLMEARNRVGFARCVIYRRILCELSGRRNSGTAFEARADLDKARKTLETLYGHIAGPFLKGPGITPDAPRERRREMHTAAYFRFPADSFWRTFLLRPRWKTFHTLRTSLLEAYVVSALFSARLWGYREAEALLADAKAVGPDGGDSPTFLLAEAESVPDYQRKLQLLRKATELDPSFEIGRYLVAHYSDLRLRQRGETGDKRLVELVLHLYDEVRKINPGNIAARIARGFLYWISGQLKEAEEEYRAAQEISSQASERFTAPLNHGLARIAAEKGDLPAAYDHFRRALSADPALATYTPVTSSFVTTPYSCIGSRMLQRFTEFKEAVLNARPKSDSTGGDHPAIGIWKRVSSFVLNDYGNALLNHFHQFGNVEMAWDARDAFEQALQHNPEHLVANWNLANVNAWLIAGNSERVRCLERARHALPDRVDVTADLALARIAVIKARLKPVDSEMETIRTEQADIVKRLLTLEALRKPNPANVAAELQGLTGSPNEVQGKEGGADLRRDYPLNVARPEDRRALEEARDRKQARLDTLEEKRKDLQEKLLCLARTGSRQILLQTTLASWLRIPNVDDLRPDGASEDLQQLLTLLADSSVQWDRLDETEASALLSVASVWSECGEKFQEGAARIIGHSLTHFWRENFDAYRILLENPLPGSLPPGFPDPDTFGSKEGVQQSLRGIIDYWLREQPYSFASMYWYLHILDQEPDYRGREDDLAAKNEYVNSLANAYCQAAALGSTVEKAKQRYRDAIATYRKVPSSPDRQFHLAQAFRGLEEVDAALAEAAEGIKAASPSHHLHNLRGILLFGKASYKECLAAYKEAISLKPTNPQYHANLGMALMEMNHLDEAEREVQTALEQAPEKAFFHQQLGRLRQKQKLPAKAVEAYRKAVELLPVQAEFYCDLGLACHELNDADEAITQMNQALELAEDDVSKARYSCLLGDLFSVRLDHERAVEAFRSATVFQSPVAEYHLRMGRACIRWREFPEALSSLQKAIDLDPKHAEPPFDLGILHSAKKEFAAAIRCFEDAIRLKSDYTEAYTQLATNHQKLGQWDKAVDAFRRAIQSDPAKAASHWNNLGTLYLEHKQFDDAVTSFRSAIDLSKTTPAFHSNLALVFANSGRFEDAVRVCAEAEDADPANATQYRLERSELLLKAGKNEDAAQVLREALSLAPPDISLYLKVANASWDQKQDETAEEACRTALDLLKLHPSFEGFMSIVLAYRARGKSDKALELLESEERARPEERHACLNLKGIVHHHNGRYETAQKEYRLAIDAKPSEPLYHANLGEALRKLNDLPGAAAEYRKAIELSPKNDLAQNQLGNILLEQEEFEQALKAYAKAKELSPGKAVHHANLATAYYRLSQKIECAAALRRALKLDPENHQYHSLLGKCLLEVSPPDNGSADGDIILEALEHIEKAIELEPNVADYHANRSHAYVRLDRTMDAVAALDRARALDPARADVFENLKGMAWFHQKKYAEAIPYFENAVRLKGDVSLYHTNLGIMLRLVGRSQEALASLERASQIEPKNADAPNHRGLVFLELKDFHRAIDQFEAAIQLNPKSTLFQSNLSVALKQAIAALEESTTPNPLNLDYKNRLKELMKNGRPS